MIVEPTDEMTAGHHGCDGGGGGWHERKNKEHENFYRTRTYWNCSLLFHANFELHKNSNANIHDDRSSHTLVLSLVVVVQNTKSLMIYSNNLTGAHESICRIETRCVY